MEALLPIEWVLHCFGHGCSPSGAIGVSALFEYGFDQQG